MPKVKSAYERTLRRGWSAESDCRGRTPVIGGNPEIAEAFAAKGTLIEFAKGDKLITEGGEDNDLYLLLTGSVAIVIKGTNVNTRVAGRVLARWRPSSRR